MPTSLTAEKINDYFRQSIHCSQIVLMEFAENLGYEQDEAMRMAAPFGGGFFRGDTCGAVAGAALAIGMKYGHDTPGDTAKNAGMIAQLRHFQDEFTRRNGSTICRELLGYDFSQDGMLAEASASGAIAAHCPQYVLDAIEILEEMGFTPAG